MHVYSSLIGFKNTDICAQILHLSDQLFEPEATVAIEIDAWLFGLKPVAVLWLWHCLHTRPSATRRRHRRHRRHRGTSCSLQPSGVTLKLWFVFFSITNYKGARQMFQRTNSPCDPNAQWPRATPALYCLFPNLAQSSLHNTTTRGFLFTIVCVTTETLVPFW